MVPAQGSMWFERGSPQSTVRSANLLWRQRDRCHAQSLAVLFGIQYVLNIVCTPLFTRKRDLTLATVDCALLTVTVAALAARAWPVRRLAALLLVPYAHWTSFATFLRWSLRQLKPEVSR